MLRYFLLPFLLFIHIASFANDIQYVTVTTYNAVPEQCDATPLITASGHRIKSPRKREMIIALSRDLKKLYKFGTKIRVTGTGRLDGVYAVEDVMNKRYTNRIDILLPLSFRHTKLYNIRINRVVECEYCHRDSNEEGHESYCTKYQDELMHDANEYARYVYDCMASADFTETTDNKLLMNYVKNYSKYTMSENEEKVQDKKYPHIVYDDKKNPIYYESSTGYWFKAKYDDNGKLKNYETSTGYTFVAAD